MRRLVADLVLMALAFVFLRYVADVGFDLAYTAVVIIAVVAARSQV